MPCSICTRRACSCFWLAFFLWRNPICHRATSLWKWLTMFILSITTNRATIILRDASSFIPICTNWTLLWEIHTLYSIIILPWLTLKFRARTYTLGTIVVGTWWARNINTSISIPSLVRWTSWITTSMLRRKPNKSRLAFTFIVQGVINLIAFTLSYLDTNFAIKPHSRRTYTSIDSRIPYLSTLAWNLWWNTSSFVVDSSLGAYALFL